MKKFKIDKEKALSKWKPVLDSLKINSEDKRSWLSEYAETHQLNEAYSTIETGLTCESNFPRLLPISMQIAARTLGHDIVTVHGVTMDKPIEYNGRVVGWLRTNGEVVWTDKQYIRELKLKRILGIE